MSSEKGCESCEKERGMCGECIQKYEKCRKKRRFSLRRFLRGGKSGGSPPLCGREGERSCSSPPSSPRPSRGASSASGVGEKKERKKDEGEGEMEREGGEDVGDEDEEDGTCCLCLWELNPHRFRCLRNCGHSFCVYCLKVYVCTEIQEGRVHLKCPKCTDLMHPNDVQISVDGDEKLITLYESLSLRRILSSDPDVRWCPAPDCNYAVIASGCASCPKISCESCPASFCYHCKAEWHPNQTCDDAAKASSRRRTSSSTASLSDVKSCPRCSVSIIKIADGSCNHLTCAVCGAEFCWLCMKEISDLHYLSPSGCTFWGQKPWSKKKKLLCQLGTLVGAPLGIALLASISVPAMIIGIPVWTGKKLHQRYWKANKHKRNCIITSGVAASIIISPIMAGIAVCIGVPTLLVYVYGVVPVSLCRSEGCGVSTSATGVKIDIEEEDSNYKPINALSNQNPSIGEVSLGASLGSACHLEPENGGEADRESASNIAVAGTSLTGSIASSYICGGHQRLEVGADVHFRKKFSFSSERLSGGGSTDNGSTRAVLSFKFGDSQSMNSTADNVSIAQTNGTEDQVSLRSLPMHNNNNSHFQNQNLQSNATTDPRSTSPLGSLSGDETLQGVVRRSFKTRKPHLDRQLSENGSLLSMEEYGSERVRFDDNVSFIDGAQNTDTEEHVSARLQKLIKLQESGETLLEETPEELALVISPDVSYKGLTPKH